MDVMLIQILKNTHLEQSFTHSKPLANISYYYF